MACAVYSSKASVFRVEPQGKWETEAEPRKALNIFSGYFSCLHSDTWSLKLSRRNLSSMGIYFSEKDTWNSNFQIRTWFHVDFMGRPEKICQRPVVWGLEVLAKSVHAQNFAWLGRIFMKVVESRTSQGPLWSGVLARKALLPRIAQRSFLIILFAPT